MIADEKQAKAYLREYADDSAMSRLSKLEVALREENDAQNLVSNNSLHEMWKRHFVDSAQLLKHLPVQIGSILDLGSGAGFPGLIIALLRPETPVTLVESRAKRIEWLKYAVQLMELKNCAVEGARVELVGTHPYGVITARAFAPLLKLLKLSARFSTSETVWVLPKGKSAAQEIRNLPPRLRRMFHVEQSVTSDDAGIIVGKGKVERA
ncbi:16S rRNA (guanine(527)-N(7))-methyltransferase RsmG [Qipengyuania spongiae]|uniref:Ribosomal RNA small subunit methyltransferase G n=1 Tax=Qipengyuania spongiae TaxID=2909673 RepID=A0ABY5T3S2_9SPHN|nr:16S rRNA (guanine(527)-N(7))-methyltransferase RsmG [Qipengyuania spongiae]UVI39978.1 16S rRNA (guanine(527)-N(7))-methyltransferase RsmG [Qipengyuania spongiae]